MARTLLQDMVEGRTYESLPANWSPFDLKRFSRKMQGTQGKELWAYQQDAVKWAAVALWKYYEDFVDYQRSESLDVNLKRKRRFYQWYQDNELPTEMNLTLSRLGRRVRRLLDDYYDTSTGEIPFESIVNRMCFWMATGSGKTLVLVKLIEVLRGLILAGEIPPNDILVLTHREDLIEQLKRHVQEFNSSRNDLYIRLRELKEYAEAKRESPSLFGAREMTVFYYRSDNLSDEQKERIIDFRNYDDNGKWYVLLDEAHKGDKEDSKRQHIYSILARNGFLFNFSATFTDERDIVTTVCDFNLARFTQAGYGKHIAILTQEFRAFRDEDDYTGDEKQKIVLKSLLLLAYCIKLGARLRTKQPKMYHRPLLLTLVNSVNTEDADLKRFFRELERAGKGEVSDSVWQAAKKELLDELSQSPAPMFEPDSAVVVQQDVLGGLKPKDLLKLVFNAGSPGEIEVLVRPSNRQELAFKLKTSERPFALIKIGDVSGWLKDELAGYEVNERFEDEGYFERLNAPDSEVNILMGSRSFYEGWDSNRPNVANFINIGVGTDARKFILQSVGRGVRIEPLEGQRQRLSHLNNAGLLPKGVFGQIQDDAKALETLFVLGTNHDALQQVIEHLKQEARAGERQVLTLFRNEEAGTRQLLIPVYREASSLMAEQRELPGFEVTRPEHELLQRYVKHLGDERVLLACYEAEPKLIGMLKKSLEQPMGELYHEGEREYRNPDLLTRRVLSYLGIAPHEFDYLKELDQEICHYLNVQVTLKDVSELQSDVDAVHDASRREGLEQDLYEKLRSGAITPAQHRAGMKKLERMKESIEYEHDGKRLSIRHVPNHYYLPVLLDEQDRADYIKHVIRTPSEVTFVRDLEKYLDGGGIGFREYDWWMFSKIDESLDEVRIPYYHPEENRIAWFLPDFIFWLRKGTHCRIVFVDPKGMAHTKTYWKLDGYRHLFEQNGQPRDIKHNGVTANVLAYCYNRDAAQSDELHRRFWAGSITELLQKVGAEKAPVTRQAAAGARVRKDISRS